MTNFSHDKFNLLLQEKIPRLQLGRWPTPLEPLSSVVAQSGGPLLLIKRDDLSHATYGGNKARKLEFLLADALRRGCKEIITGGGLGSHHVLAAAALGREAGLNTTGLFFCQPINDHVRQNLHLECSFGTEMHFVRDYPGLVKGYLRLYLARRLASGRRPYLLMPGGSNPLSTLGYINAAVEMREQLKIQGLPDPAAVFTATGTGGTAAGLLAGFALLGMDTKLHAVRVVYPSILKRKGIISLARKTLRWLSRLGVDIGGAEARLSPLLCLEEDYLGEGYGFGTADADGAMKSFKELAGIDLEGCYTGKAAAAFLDYCRTPGTDSSRPVIFIHTASTTHLEQECALNSGAQLPADFSWCIQGGACRGPCALRKRNRSFCEMTEQDGWRWG